MDRQDRERTRLESLAGEWLRDLVLPRLHELSAAFPHAGTPRVMERAIGATLGFERTDDYPAQTQVEIRIGVLPAEESRLRIVFSTSVIPMFYAFESGLSLEVKGDPGGAEAAGSFLSERIVRFAREYLRVREADSPYQRGQEVVDPVCGMKIRRADAVATIALEGRTYHFCAESCRKRFEATPSRYAPESGR